MQTKPTDLNPVDERLLELQNEVREHFGWELQACLLYTSPSPRDGLLARMPSSA